MIIIRRANKRMNQKTKRSKTFFLSILIFRLNTIDQHETDSNEVTPPNVLNWLNKQTYFLKPLITTLPVPVFKQG